MNTHEAAMGTRNIDDILQHRKILITCGTGGVGKTTLSAAMALRAAMLGRRTVVITIDPAKRLATSLGMDPNAHSGSGIGDQAVDLTPRLREAALTLGLPAPTGTLAAIMPDTRRTFEDFVRSIAPHPAAAEKVISNSIFKTFAREFSGTNEYMALQRLNSLADGNLYDLILLDTPPSRNTLAFLKAPMLLAEFFDEKIMRWLVLPANKLVSAGMRKALSILEGLTGASFMSQLFEFAGGLFELREGFLRSLHAITELLQSEGAGFFLVSAPAPDAAEEITHFVDRVHERGFHFDGLAVNRTLGALKPTSETPTDAPSQAALRLIEALRLREEQAIQELLQNSSAMPFFARLPELARDVHSVEDLMHVALAFGDLRRK